MSRTRTAISRTGWAWLRLAGGAAILAALVSWLGAGPFLDGLASVDVPSVLLAVLLGLLATVCAAWRWSRIADRLGVGLPLSTAVAAYYRSQFLNTVLPGGVLGDLHRAADRGRATGSWQLSARAVGWDRFAGQIVQMAIALPVLTVAPSPVRSVMPAVDVAVGLVLVAAVPVLRRLPRTGTSRLDRTVRAVRSDLGGAVFSRRSWPVVTSCSAVVVAAHTTTFLVAARAAGVTAATDRLIPLLLLVLLAMSVPTAIAGWGPREGAAVGLFVAAGLGSGPGLATATVYGVLTIASTLPGGLVLLASTVRRRPRPTDEATVVDADREVVLHG